MERISQAARLGVDATRTHWPNGIKVMERIAPRLLAWLGAPYMDMTGYHRFLPQLQRKGVFRLPGDILEVGAFVGVGTSKLAEIASATGKTVYAIDIFDPAADRTVCVGGRSMADGYSAGLGGHSQWDAYQRNIRRRVHCIVTIRGDSKGIELPQGLGLCFAFIDGNHDPSYVESDFRLAWSRLVPGGVVGFDDYGFDLPRVTSTIDRLVFDFSEEIDSVWRGEPKEIFIRKACIERPR